MRRRILISAVILSALINNTVCFAQSQYSPTLTRMEKSLFGVDYNSQSDENRIKRIEESVYGGASNKPIQQRFSKLSKDLSAEQIGQEIKPKSDTFADADTIDENIPKADSSVKYPAVDNLEMKVFNTAYPSEDINKRLAKLEQNVFKKAYNDDLNSRVDRLKMAIAPSKVSPNNYSDDDDSDSFLSSDDNTNSSSYNDTDHLADNDYFGTNMPQSIMGGSPTGMGANIPSYNRNNSVLDNYSDSPDLDVSIGALEKQVLKRTYPNDTISNRLLRMEVKVFNSTFTEDDEQTRFDRIASAYQAKKTSRKYDNNKFTQHSATAMQIGAILLMILAAIL